MITIAEQSASDIDWFFTNGEDIAFAASAGGMLPDSVAASFDNSGLTNFFRSLPSLAEVEINPDLNDIIEPPVDERYLSDFIFMTARGLFAYDKTTPNIFSDPHYHLVAKPSNPLKIENLPGDIQAIVLKTKLNARMGARLNITFIK